MLRSCDFLYREMVGLSEHGQPDPDIWGSHQLPAEPEEGVQRAHGESEWMLC